MYLFNPILKQTLWGGMEIHRFKGWAPREEKIGESWELSHVKGNESIVTNGPMTGMTVGRLIKVFGARLTGKKVMRRFGTTFPLLIKLIDAHDDLSIQVHPNDELAQIRHHSAGKTEMWYVVQAAPGATLYSGFSRQIDADEYQRRVEDHSITDVLRRYEVTAGDVFFLPAGRVHAIGAGCFIAEIQQTSNITYRIYDYNRKDASGSERALHTEQARDAIDYTLLPDYRTTYTPCKNKVVPLVCCEYFTANLLEIDQPLKRNPAALDSFIVYLCTEGRALLRDDKRNELTLRQGQTVLIPANVSTLTLSPSPQATLLETYI